MQNGIVEIEPAGPQLIRECDGPLRVADRDKKRMLRLLRASFMKAKGRVTEGPVIQSKPNVCPACDSRRIITRWLIEPMFANDAGGGAGSRALPLLFPALALQLP